jgi:hypothetical protein
MSRRALRSVAGRVGAAAYALWIVVALSPLGAAPCPLHDGPGAVAAMAMRMPSSAMVMPGASASSSGEATQHAPAQHPHHHTCTCVGCGCCVAILDFHAPARTTVPAPAIVARGTLAPLPSRTVAVRGVDRRLPFANAPPDGVLVLA